MELLQFLLTCLRDPPTTENAVRQAADRLDPLLRLGRCLRERYADDASTAESVECSDAQIRRLEHRLGFAPHRLMSVDQTTGSDQAARWKEHLLAGLVQVSGSPPHPQVVIIAGQPGSGTECLVEETCRYFGPRDGCVVISRRELSLLHRIYFESSPHGGKSHCSAAPFGVDNLAGELLNRALSAGKNAVIEEDFSGDPAGWTFYRDRVERSQRQMELIALCVPPGFSWSATQAQNTRLLNYGFDGLTDMATHTAACHRLIQFLADPEQERSRLTVVSLSGQVLCSRSPQDNARSGTIRDAFLQFQRELEERPRSIPVGNETNVPPASPIPQASTGTGQAEPPGDLDVVRRERQRQKILKRGRIEERDDGAG